MDQRIKPEAISATSLASMSPCEMRFVLLMERGRQEATKTDAARRGDLEHLRYDARAKLMAWSGRHSSEQVGAGE